MALWRNGPLYASESEPINPRYVAYCAAQGRGVEEQHAHDKALYPLAPTLPFIRWVGDDDRARPRAANAVAFEATRGGYRVRDKLFPHAEAALDHALAVRDGVAP